MRSVGWGRRRGRKRFDDEVRAVVSDLAADVGTWRLDEAGWEPVRAALARLADAARRRDVRSFAAARADLDILGPDRVVRFGEVPDPDVVPAPGPVRELLAELEPLAGADTDRRP